MEVPPSNPKSGLPLGIPTPKGQPWGLISIHFGFHFHSTLVNSQTQDYRPAPSKRFFADGWPTKMLPQSMKGVLIG
jgi:hypothetical protein